ncbi:Aspartyl/glutamyl-tRNA amidotransferase subunit B-related protein [Paramyrothecium foliicola]|nr:Aspartyl/glutamyl-tRNA amidotransferase subunit B-related protein [Paramyrothecium foliicola]
MAAISSKTLFRALRSSLPSRAPAPSMRLLPRFYSTSTEDAPPPLLQKLKGDLKTAMRAKDAPRLAVLRSIMSANLNASKTASPIRTDVQLVGLIRKLQKSANDAVADAKTAGRDDLVQKELEQVRIYDDYVADSGVQTIGEVELKAMVQEAVDALKSAGTGGKSLMGETMKRLSGALEGKDVDKKELSKLIQEVIKS